MAMLYALLLMVVVVGIGALMFARTVAEIQHSGDDAAIVQTLLLARGAANAGGQVLAEKDRVIWQEIEAAVTDNANAGRWTFGTGAVGNTPDTASVTTAMRSLADDLQANIDEALCGASSFAPSTGGTGQFRVYFTQSACGLELPSEIRLPSGRYVSGAPRVAGTVTANAEQVYALPFAMVAEGALSEYRRNVVLQGEFRVVVGRGTFAKYALFTNVHRTGSADNSSTRVWFTGDTLFDGPVHTNNHFRFYRNPWFGGTVTTAGCNDPGPDECDGSFNRRGGEFYGVGFVNHLDMDPNSSAPSYSNGYGTHAPTFGQAHWQSNFVPLPENLYDQSAAAADSGLVINHNVYSLTVSARDATGALLTPNGAGDSYSPEAAWQYIESCRRNSGGSRGACTTYRYDASGNMYEWSSGSWSLQEEDFNGVIYVNGLIERFTGPGRTSSNSPATARPAVASFAQMTLAAQGQIRITGDLKYEDQPCTGVPTRNPDGSVTRATCDNVAAENVLGVYTQSGDVLIGNNNSTSTAPGEWYSNLNAPNDVHIHGVLMSSEGRVTVEDYDEGPSNRGDVHLMGGIIEYYYGAFGTFNAESNTQLTGFGRKFTYDQRMSLGVSPPYFPGPETADQLVDVQLFSFGQREQIY